MRDVPFRNSLKGNAEGVCDLHPRVARASALPWVVNSMFHILESPFSAGRPAALGNPFRVAIPRSLITQGSRARRVNPGLELVNAYGVHVRDCQPSLITQLCHCP